MSRRNTKSQAVVVSLLDERRQYQEWLDKLANPGAAGAPSPVVERVRADYQSRLENVTRQLARHEGDLQTALGEAEMRRDLAAGRRTARQDALTEAVLRHEVGEYGDEKFAALSEEHTSVLAQLAEDIESADRDITRLEEVLGLIARVLPEPAPPTPVPSATEPATPRAAEEAVGRVAEQLRGLDELSFLRSVAGGAALAHEPTVAAEEAPASPARESPRAGGAAPTPSPAPEAVRAPRVSRPVMPPAAIVPPPEPPAPEPQAPPPAPATKRAAPEGLESPSRTKAASSPEFKPEPRPDRAPDPRMGDLPLPMPVHQIVPDIPHEPKPSARVSRRASSAAEAADDVARKTLRCTECGTFNLPTEWYCAKCGAELSAF